MGVTAEITNGLPVSAYLLAFATVALVLVAIRFVLKSGQGSDSSGLGGLFIGQDKRTSTSKVTAAMWTIALIYAYAAQLFDGRLEVGVLQEEYLFLLGGPYAALVAAKAITTSKIDSGTVDKQPLEDDDADKGKLDKARDRAAEIVSDDSGELAIADFQYFAFNLLALVYFFVAFVSDPSGVAAMADTTAVVTAEPTGLPDMPETLVGLSTAAAAGYLGRKGVEKGDGTFQLESVRPTKVVLGDTSSLVIAGSDFVKEGEGPTRKNAVLLDGITLGTDGGWTADVVTAQMTGYEAAGIRANPRADLVVHNHAGRQSQSLKVQIVDAPPS